MKTDLSSQIHQLMERGISPVSADEAISRQPGRMTPLRHAMTRSGARSRQAAAFGAGITALACAAALVAAQLGGNTRPARPASIPSAQAIITTAMMRHLASASRLALAHSGRARIDYRDSLGGVVQDWGTQDIVFSGRNYSFADHEHLPAQQGQRATRQFAINRVVQGRAYDYFTAADGLRWYHVTGPDAVQALAIPNPRKLLRELTPSAAFVLAGHTTVGGVRLNELRATHPQELPDLRFNGVAPGTGLTSLLVWVDNHGVVRRMSFTSTRSIVVFKINTASLHKDVRLGRLRKTDRLSGVGRQMRADSRHEIVEFEGTKGRSSSSVQVQSSTLVVSFLDIGRPQVITAPADAITISGRG